MKVGKRMDMNKISVIIPVFNTEQYLERCLNSLFMQSYHELEIIVVDDGSDKNVQTLFEKKPGYDKVHWIRLEKNRGLFCARVAGMEQATGDYLAFLDSDDEVSVDYYRLLIKKAESECADITIGEVVEVKPNGRFEYYNFHKASFSFPVLRGSQVKEAYFEQMGQCYSWHTVWNKLYSRRLVERCLPFFRKQREHLVMTEDIAFSSLFFYLAECAVPVERAVYFYRKDTKGVTTSTLESMKNFDDSVRSMCLSFTFVEKCLDELRAEKKIRKNFEEFRKRYVSMWTARAGRFQKPEETKEAYRIVSYLGKTDQTWGEDEKFFDTVSTLWDDTLEKIKREILYGKHKYISFDIFDTLVVRPFIRPEDIYVLMDREYEKKNTGIIPFHKMRTDSEMGARFDSRIRNSNQEDVTLDEIYEYMGRIYGISPDICLEMKQKELEQELKFLEVRWTVRELYDLAILAGRQVIFVSDTFFDKKFIQKLLKKAGIEKYNGLFLSSS